MRLEEIFYPIDTIANPADIIFGLAPLIQNCTTIEFPETLMWAKSPTTWRLRDTKQEACPMRFGQALGFALSEKISDGLDDVYSEDDNGNLSIDRTNIRLTAALLSASATKHNLQHVEQHNPLGIVLLRLQNPHMHLQPKMKEVYGVVAIIHLAIVGDRMRETLESDFPGEAELTQALKILKQKRR